MITSLVVADFFPALKSELDPFPFFDQVYFDESLEFDNVGHSVWVQSDENVKLLHDDKNLIMILWNREPVQVQPELARRGVTYQAYGTAEAKRYYKRNVAMPITVGFICSSFTTGELLEEWLLSKDLYKLKGSYSLDLKQNPTDAPLVKDIEWTITAVRPGALQRLDPQKFGTMISFSVGFTVSYPIILSQEIVKQILQIDENTHTV